jgi:hypothetical protein
VSQRNPVQQVDDRLLIRLPVLALTAVACVPSDTSLERHEFLVDLSMD